MNFNSFEKGIPLNYEYEEAMTKQVPPGGTVEAVKTIAKASQVATTSAVIGSTLLNVVMSGALSQVWGMINGMQVMVHLPSLAVNFPGNAMIVVEQILVIATFDIPYLDIETLSFGYWALSEDDSIFSDLEGDQVDQMIESFDSLSYGSRYMS